MRLTPKHIKGVSNHAINDAFLKTAVQDEKKILVIDANLNHETNSIETLDDSYVHLLDHLELLSKRVQTQTSDVDYIDIRVH
jgi:hypothetical protein